MNALFIAVFAALAVYAADAGLVGAHHGSGAIVSGPSGIVTSHGAIGPHSLGLGHGWGHQGAIVAAPVIPTSYVAGPVAYGVGHGLGYAGNGLGYGGLGYGSGLGYGGYGHGGVVSLSHHGVAVKGPETVPAVISGPSGKIVADGLYGVPSHHYGHGYGW